MPPMRSIHDVRPDAFDYVWDNSIEPVLEIESGEAVGLHVRDASDEQIHEGSGVEDVAKLDFTHVNPVSGPVFVKGAAPGDVLEVELLEFRPQGWGWTAIIPGFGLLADEFPDPWLRISAVEGPSGGDAPGAMSGDRRRVRPRTFSSRVRAFRWAWRAISTGSEVVPSVAPASSSSRSSCSVTASLSSLMGFLGPEGRLA